MLVLVKVHLPSHSKLQVVMPVKGWLPNDVGREKQKVMVGWQTKERKKQKQVRLELILYEHVYIMLFYYM